MSEFEHQRATMAKAIGTGYGLNADEVAEVALDALTGLRRGGWAVVQRSRIEELLAALDELAQDTPQDRDDEGLAGVIDHAERNAAAEAYGDAAKRLREVLAE